MKKAILLLLFVLLVDLPIYAGDKKTPVPAAVDQKIFKLNGDNAWLDTGFLLRPGDRVTINASGQVFFSNGESHSGTTPDGYNREAYEEDFLMEDAAHCLDPNGNWSHAALIGKDVNGMFLLGKSRLVTGKKGKLFIGINDCSLKKKYYNTGEFIVTVKVARSK